MLLDWLELTPGGRSLLAAGAGVGSFPAALAASRETDSGNGLSFAVGFLGAHRSQRTRTQPWRRRGKHLPGKDCRLARWAFWDRPLGVRGPDAALRRLETASGKAIVIFGRRQAWTRSQTGCALVAGFFCGWGASGDGCALLLACAGCWPNVSRAVIEATIRGRLRIVAVFKFRPYRAQLRIAVPAPISVLWTEKLVKN